MLAAISYNQQQYYKNNNNNNRNTIITTALPTTYVSEPLTKIINSNKSSLIRLKQQQQQLQQIITSTLSSSTLPKPTTTTTSQSLSASILPTPLLPPHPYYSDKTTPYDHSSGNGNGNDTTNSVYFGDSSLSDEETSGILEPNDNSQESPLTPPQKHQPNTYTSTTYYGSGYGVFHQQNIRTNGGGIALITGSSGSNGLSSSSYSAGINNNVNLLLGGAMLTLITTILCVVCYCCHRNIKKRTEAAYRQQRQWLENDPNMEIYSVEQCYETSGLFVGESIDGLATIPALHHEPPPSYDAVVAMQEQQQLLIQQHQQQLLMQQQIPTNNSPPPGYRSSLDVHSIISQGGSTGLGSVLGIGGSVVSGMDINSLTSSTANIGAATSHSPIDPQLNNNDLNGNMTTATPLTIAATPTNNTTTTNFLRNKQQQQQRNVRTSQLNQLNMKKALQAQSCCSLQRAEVENMWNAAAAALAARSAHLPNDTRVTTPTTASTSSPTLAMNVRKLSQGYVPSSKSNTPETFGSRYLKQNYYRRGCPLCGKFRYDNDSTLSTSMESNLDTVAGALTEAQSAVSGQDKNIKPSQTELNSNSNNKNSTDRNDNNEISIANDDEEKCNTTDNPQNDKDDELDERGDNECETEKQCSCFNSDRKNNTKYEKQNRYQRISLQQDNSDHNTAIQNKEERQKILTPTDANANCSLTAERQSTNQPSNNNNNNNYDITMDLPSTSSATTTTLRTPITVASHSPNSINLDCINENGIISLDMSKIIDKTGLPTYDAALKLESSGYV